MARQLRIELPGAWYHVTARGNERKAIFRQDGDRRHFLDLLEETVHRHRVLLHSYALMENHYHLILETPEANLSSAMQWLGVSYSTWCNRRHHRVGHLFQGRFKGILVEQMKELGEKTGGMDYGSVALALDRIGKRLREDRALARAYERVEKRL